MFQRRILKENAKRIYNAYALKAIIGGGVLWLVSNTSFINIVNYEFVFESTEQFSIRYVNPIFGVLSLPMIVILILAIVSGLVLAPIATMVKNYYKDLSMGNEYPDAMSVIRNGMFLKLSIVVILSSIIIGIGFIAMVIPGLYLTYSLRYVGLITIDNPELSVGEIIKESIRLTRGYKFSLFVLDLSFFGWQFLIAFIGIISLGILTIVGSIVLLPYIELTDIQAYRYLVLNNPLRENY